MLIYRCILPDWKLKESPELKKVEEGAFSEEDIKSLNEKGYNIYYLPNFPSLYEGGTVDGFHIDTFNYVFVDMDLKDGHYKTKEDFYEALGSFPLEPSMIVDSGNGVHAYWKVLDLDAISYLKLSRRLMRWFNTDEAVGQIYQLMRAPDTINTKVKGDFKLCEPVFVSKNVYTCEELSKNLPLLSPLDEQFCTTHYEKTYRLNKEIKIDDKLPSKFSRMLLENEEIKDIWQGKSDNRSKADFRLGHLLFANGFKKEEAASVLVNTAKALARAPIHRLSYAMNIIDKIWTYEDTSNKVKLYEDVEDILARNAEESTSKKFKCHPLIDGVNSGFSLGQVLGLVGGAGSGKTTFSLNFFKWFVERNPDYIHFYVSLEQPVDEIAKRWRTLCQDNTNLNRKVKILGNYNQDGTYRNLSLLEIKVALKEFEAETGSKVGCVVLDHIGILNKNLKNGETQGLIEICQNLKSFAIETNTFFIIQSQTTREKAGIGDLELNKDAAFGTTTFEWYVDFLMTIWQPLKRVYDVAPNMTVMAFKYCKIRHKNVKLDKVKEDQRYLLMFDPMNENLRSLTKDEKTSFEFFNNRATNLRKQDRKTDVLEYKTTDWTKE